MLHNETYATIYNGLERPAMPKHIEGRPYYSSGDIVSQLGVTRQTLWRWRREGKIPAGYRYRDRWILYTELEFQEIQRFANRVEPIDDKPRNQLTLFGRAGGG